MGGQPAAVIRQQPWPNHRNLGSRNTEWESHRITIARESYQRAGSPIRGYQLGRIALRFRSRKKFALSKICFPELARLQADCSGTSPAIPKPGDGNHRRRRGEAWDQLDPISGADVELTRLEGTASAPLAPGSKESFYGPLREWHGKPHQRGPT